MSRCLPIRLLLLAAAVLSAPPAAAAAVRCFDEPGDPAAIVAARAAVKAACGCFDFSSHGIYVSCAAGVLSGRVGAGQLRRECFRKAKAEPVVSVCGKSVGRYGPAVACVGFSPGGKALCRIKPALRCASACPGSPSCIAAADDDGDLFVGAGDSGLCAPGSTLIDNGDGTVTDPDTGLMWEKLDDAGGVHDKDVAFSWSSATGVKIAALNASGGLAGHADWRLPTIAELQTLVRPGASPATASELDAACLPGCDAASCSCTRPDFYWSSTTTSNEPAKTWGAFFGTGGVFAFDRAGFTLYVRAVRRVS